MHERDFLVGRSWLRVVGLGGVGVNLKTAHATRHPPTVPNRSTPYKAPAAHNLTQPPAQSFSCRCDAFLSLPLPPSPLSLFDVFFVMSPRPGEPGEAASAMCCAHTARAREGARAAQQGRRSLARGARLAGGAHHVGRRRAQRHRGGAFYFGLSLRLRLLVGNNGCAKEGSSESDHTW